MPVATWHDDAFGRRRSPSHHLQPPGLPVTADRSRGFAAAPAAPGLTPATETRFVRPRCMNQGGSLRHDESEIPLDEVEHNASVRTEYSALTSYFGRVISFRFTTLGFFLTAVALVVRSGPASRSTSLLLLGLAVGLWIVELRNRTVFRCLGNRAIEIELLEWNRHDPRQGRPLFCRMFRRPHDVAELDSVLAKLREEPVRILFWTLPGWKIASGDQPLDWLVRHTIGIDIVYLSVIGYCIAKLISPGTIPNGNP